ncbi:MAG: S-methyl-5'-thioinosine phosphorylase [Pseudomonadales bacterium]|jgi:5'-methylthioinosine phosphorylase
MLGIISGSGVLPLFAAGESLTLPVSRYGTPSGIPRQIRIAGQNLVVLPRHGYPHHAAPHRINYRANIDTLVALGVTRVVALTTVGGISPAAWTGRLVVPDQIIDYTWGRAHTFVDDEDAVTHADFAEPFDADLRVRLIAAARDAGIDIGTDGVYGCTQGPRFETVAEINRMERDGCTLVGMTGMPEAGLARERGLAYAMLSLVVNPAAGRAQDPFDLDAIWRVMASGMESVQALLGRALAAGL